MFVKQISVFLENSQGRLYAFSKLLGEAGVDLIALSIADTTNFGILRGITTDTDKAVAALRDGGFTVSVTEVLAVAVPDRPGGLADALKVLKDHDIGVEYLYSFVRNVNNCAMVIFRVEDCARAAELLTAAGIQLLSQDEIRGAE